MTAAGSPAKARVFWAFFICALCALALTGAAAQDWPEWGGKGGARHSGDRQINRTTVPELEIAWTYRTGEEKRRGELFYRGYPENTPILAAGSLIICTPFKRIIALDPVSGEERWAFEAGHDPKVVLPGFTCRGVAAWTDEQAEAEDICHTRILLATLDFRLIAIDARTGEPCPGFGEDGQVQASYDKERVFSGEVLFKPLPTVVNGIMVVGSMVSDGTRADGPSGMVRAFDARTGALRWTFDPVPRDPKNPMYATWGGVADKIGGANVWAPMVADEERDLLFLPTSSPSNDYYGGRRAGDNRYSNSVVALRGATGEIVWHFQISHHDVWDYDLPSQPILIDLERDGEMIPALVQITKQGFVFVFNRETGEPLFPVEERPVPQGGVPGEQLSPTQPFPVAPPPFIKQGVTVDDAWGFTFVDRWYCKQTIAASRQGGIYTPPSLEGTTVQPGVTGGGNWGGGAFDPGTGLLVVSSTRIPASIRLVPASAEEDRAKPPKSAGIGYLFPQSGDRYMADTKFIMSPFGAPCTKPPWGGLTAIDLNDGTIEWDVKLGSIHRMTPLPFALPFYWNLGTPVAGGPMVTAGGLVFIGAAADRIFRAFDIETGEVLWKDELPAGANANPMTYTADGRQYVVIVAGGHGRLASGIGDYVVAYALPR